MLRNSGVFKPFVNFCSMSVGPRKIIHIDMDAFFASVEQRDNPELRGKPVAVGGSGSRGVVAAASYEARKFGVFSAMSSRIAQEKCPDLIFVKPRFDKYKTVSLVIRSIFRQYTDFVEPLSLDEAYLDVTHNKLGLKSATAIAREIKSKIKDQTNLTASAGISVNKFLAKIASDMDKPDGLFVIPPQKVNEFIRQLPVEKFFGVGKVTAAKMKQMGIHTGKELEQKSLAELVEHFGKAGNYFFNVAHGIDDRPVVPHRERKSLGAENTYAVDYTTLLDLDKKLEELSETVFKRISKANSWGKTITVKVKLSNFSQMTRSHTQEQVFHTQEAILKQAKLLLREAFDTGMAVRLLGITISNFSKEMEVDPQLTLDFE